MDLTCALLAGLAGPEKLTVAPGVLLLRVGEAEECLAAAAAAAAAEQVG